MARTVSPIIRSEAVPSGTTRQGRVGIDLDEGQVVLGITGHDHGMMRRLVAEPAPHRNHVIDHVIAGDDVAARIDDNAGAHAADGHEGRAPARILTSSAGDLAFGMNIATALRTRWTARTSGVKLSASRINSKSREGGSAPERWRGEREFPEPRRAKRHQTRGVGGPARDEVAMS